MSQIIKFSSGKVSEKNEKPVTSTSTTPPSTPVQPSALPTLSDLMGLIQLIPTKTLVDAADVCMCNWVYFKGFVWDTVPDSHPLLWTIIPLDHDGGDLIRRSNWYSMFTLLEETGPYIYKPLRLQHPAGVVRALSIKVRYNDQTPASKADITTPFRQFFSHLSTLQKGELLDDEDYRTVWEWNAISRIRELGRPFAKVGAQEKDHISGKGRDLSPGWPRRVFNAMLMDDPTINHQLKRLDGKPFDPDLQQVQETMGMLGVLADVQAVQA